ncbi:MAG: hypothetical protein SFV17_24865 [Candidatus Obscuribacter sp.]|nr:hypothetical protein [Candidatus Melainabacteria bacterium]MDX1989948.1 hypothetical protein [Candidatus Obscuribacter sp.]
MHDNFLQTRQNNAGTISKPLRVESLGALSTGEKLSYVSRELADALSDSSFVDCVRQGDLKAGKEICLLLWPFVKELPDNISAVRTKLEQLPHDGCRKNLDAGLKLLSQLADDERHYQNLYLSQCRLAGLSEEELKQVVEAAESNLKSKQEPVCDPAGETNFVRLTRRMRYYCRQGSAAQAVLVVITAELAATQFARAALSAFESYFMEREEQYGRESIEAGLMWLRLHAKPNTRHALWMKRLLLFTDTEAEASEDTFNESAKTTDLAVTEILECLIAVWRTPRFRQERPN